MAFVLATATLAVSPGPDNIFVLTQSIANGKRKGLATVYGLISGCLVHTSLLAFGVSALIKENESIYFIIKLFGAAYLVYLAFMVCKSPSDINLQQKGVTDKSDFQLFKQGFIMNVLNPKVTIFFLAFFPGFLFSETISALLQFYILGLLFMFVSFIIFSLIAILASQLSSFIKGNNKVGVVLKWLQVSVFLGIAVYLLFSNK